MNDEALTTWCDRLDRFSAVTGRAVAWLTLLMVLVTVVVVVLRYAFDIGLIWLQESLTWMHAAVFMLGAAWTLERDEHVRVDVFYRDLGERRRGFVNLLGTLLFVLPLCGLVLYEGWPWVLRAWEIREVSRDTGGLPYPAIPLLKSVLLVMPLAVALQGVSLALRAVIAIRRG